ncbi:hypothetical protein Bca4012_019746 [Brassica carinata]
MTRDREAQLKATTINLKPLYAQEHEPDRLAPYPVSASKDEQPSHPNLPTGKATTQRHRRRVERKPTHLLGEKETIRCHRSTPNRRETEATKRRGCSLVVRHAPPQKPTLLRQQLRVKRAPHMHPPVRTNSRISKRRKTERHSLPRSGRNSRSAKN